MNSKNAGFTLIELVLVIVILGILSAVALPKFVNLKDDADRAVLQGFAGAFASATAINYGSKLAGNAAAITVAKCGDITGTLLQSPLPMDVSVGPAAADAADAAVAPGATKTCVVKKMGVPDAPFTAVGA